MGTALSKAVGVSAASAAAAAAPVPTAQHQARYGDDGTFVKSLSSVMSTDIQVVNTTQYSIDVLWLDFVGDAVSYCILRPGYLIRLQTYITHPWTFRAVGNPAATPYLVLRDSGKQVLFPSEAQNDYIVEMAPSLAWTSSLHLRHWTNESLFNSRVATLLLCHHRLSRAVPSGHELCAGLGDIPHDVLLAIIQHMAPPVPDVVPTEQADMVLPPAHLMDQHHQVVAAIQAHLAAGQPLHLLQQQVQQ